MPLDSEGLRDLAEKHERDKAIRRAVEEALSGRAARGGSNGHLVSLVKVVTGVTIVVLAALLLGGIALYREFVELKSDVKANAAWVEWLKQQQFRDIQERERR